MPIDECFQAAFQSENPVENLRSLASSLSSQGYDRVAIINKFERSASAAPVGGTRGRGRRCDGCDGLSRGLVQPPKRALAWKNAENLEDRALPGEKTVWGDSRSRPIRPGFCAGSFSAGKRTGAESPLAKKKKKTACQVDFSWNWRSDCVSSTGTDSTGGRPRRRSRLRYRPDFEVTRLGSWSLHDPAKEEAGVPPTVLDDRLNRGGPSRLGAKRVSPRTFFWSMASTWIWVSDCSTVR